MAYLILALLIIPLGYLYRTPRGGPIIGDWPKKSFIGATIWAIPLACAVTAAAGCPLWMIPAWYVYLMLAESRMGAWADYGPNDTANKEQHGHWQLTLFGMILLSPLYGVCYHYCYEYQHKLPSWGRNLTGWTAWAEFTFGVSVAATQIGLSILMGVVL